MSTNEQRAREIMGVYIEYPETYVERITAALNAKDAIISEMREALELIKEKTFSDPAQVPELRARAAGIHAVTCHILSKLEANKEGK